MEAHCPNKARNLESCACTADCVRKGTCCDCVANHRKNGNLPACLRPAE
ncbi:hypothetical protein HOB36_04295 [Candidatus Bathyarchaeota archaeon]|nr:hypothetical protein [Candidatus Bathyarchaeota archaeon]